MFGQHGLHGRSHEAALRRTPVFVILSYLLHDPALLASAALIAALLLARTLSGQPLLNGENMRLALAQQPTLESQLQDGTFDTAPDDLREALGEELTALQGLSSATSTGGQALAYARYLSIDERLIGLGYLQEGDDSATSLAATEAERTFYERLAALDDPRLYETPRDEPLLVALCDGTLSLPALLWYLPALMAVAACADLRERGRVLAQAPRIRRELCDESIAAWLVAVLANWGATLPSCLAALRNGLGDPTYPVVFLWGGEVIADTVAGMLARAVLLQALGALLVVALGLLASLLVTRARLASLVAGGSLLGAASAFMQVVSARTSSFIPSLLPLPYLLVSLYAQRPQCAYFQELQPLAGTSLSRGMAVQVCWSAVLIVLIFFAASRPRRNI